MRLARYANVILWTATILVAVGFTAATRAPAFGHEGGAIVVAAALTVSILAAALMGVVASEGHAQRLRLAVTPVLLAAGAGAFLMIVEDGSARKVLAVATIALLAAYAAYARGTRHDQARFSHADFSHLAFVVHVATVFFWAAAAFGGRTYLPIPLFAAAAAFGLIVGIISDVTLAREQGGSGDRRTVVAAFAAVGAELFAALSFLPTGHLVNAMAVVILFAAGLHAARELLSPVTVRPPLRRHFAWSAALLLLVLCTAQWA